MAYIANAALDNRPDVTLPLANLRAHPPILDVPTTPWMTITSPGSARL
jgi:hypothetical protein